MSNITAIIPLHDFNDEIKSYLEKCLTSIEKQTFDKFESTIIILPLTILNQVQDFIKEKQFKCEILENNIDTSFQTQVNLAISKVNTEFFTIIEFDDEISSKYLENMVNHIEHNKNIDIFMPVVLEINKENKKVKDTNIQAWSKQLVGEDFDIGYLNKELLMSYTDFKLSGSVIRKSIIHIVGEFKKNVKFSFILEFMLRCLKNNTKIYIVPKILYKHVNDREGSMTEHFLKNLTKKELKFWFDKAISESDYFMDREIIEE